MTKRFNLDDYYTVEEARARLSANSGREIDKNYPRTLARYGDVRIFKIGRATLYLKKDIDEYKVKATRGPRKQKPDTDVEDEDQAVALAI